MSVKTLSTTLEQLHVTLRSLHEMDEDIPSEGLEFPSMMNLHTFTLIQSILSGKRVSWSMIESLTASTVMPVLRRVSLAIFITVDEVHRTKTSFLFTDDRRIDVQFAFIVDNGSLGLQLSHQIPHGSRFHPREVVGVTCVVKLLSDSYEESTNLNCYVSILI